MNKVHLLMPEVLVAISYKDIYSDFNTVNPEDFIKDIPTIPLLKFIVERFNKVLYAFSDTTSQLSLLREFNPKLPKEARNKVFKYTKRHLDKVLIYTHESVTMFTQIAIQNYVPLENEEDDYIAEDEYEKIYKTILYCNQIWTDNQLKSDDVKEKSLIDVSILIDLPIIEFKRFKDFRYQLFKALRFFEFCENDNTFKSYLPYFLKEKNVNTWREYVYKLFKYYEQSLNSFIFDNADPFIDQFLIKLNDTDINTLWSDHIKGLLYLRNKFFFPISNKQYILLNPNLLVDKIYQAIKFDLFNVIRKYSLPNPAGKCYKCFPDFNSKLGETFSESSLLYHIIEKTFSNNKCVLYNGTTLKTYWKDGEPDYYIREDDAVFLFEHKDLLLGDNIKFSKDIGYIKEEILKRLCYDDGKDRKGAGQLLYSIDRILNKGVMNNSDPEISKIKYIFPIITVTDSAFSAMGVNAVVIESFENLIKKYQFKKGIFISRPIIIDYNDLVYLSYRLHKGVLNLKDVLMDFIKRAWKNMQSFSTFIQDEYKIEDKNISNELKYMFPEFH